MKIRVVFLFLLLSFTHFKKSFAWGPEGHAIVGRIAMQFLKEDLRKNVLSIMGKMPVDTAANWMDIMKSNADYDFMRSWHYIDFPDNQPYIAGNNENIINRLLLTYNELTHKKLLCDAQIQTNLFILLHLMGDLHMPLHTGYEEDLGGNKIMVQYDTLKNHNLHTFWDVDIISLGKITDADCLQHYNSIQFDTLKTVNFVSWMNDSRSLLNQVYDFPDFILDKAYLLKNKTVVEKQLLKAGLRLALLLNKLFYTATPLINYKEATEKYKNGIEANAAMSNLGKKVTVCSRVYSIRSTPTITQISIGDKYPNNPLTIIIFSKNYAKFKQSFEELFTDKNICVKGIIEEYKGKAQIIVNDPDEIIIQ